MKWDQLNEKSWGKTSGLGGALSKSWQRQKKNMKIKSNQIPELCV